MLEGVQLAQRLLAIRGLRAAGRVDEARDALAVWQEERTRWAQQLRGEAAGSPLGVLVEQLGLTDAELDVMLVALGPEVDPDFLDHAARHAGRMLFRGLDVELVLSTVFQSEQDRLRGREVLDADSRLVRQGLLHLVPHGGALSPHDVEVRPTDTLANYVLGRPILSGPLARYCVLTSPTHEWETVALPPEQMEFVWRVVSPGDTLPDRIAAWGYERVIPAGRGVTLLFSGPPGTGKTAFAHAIAARLGRSVLRVETSKLLGAQDALRPILADVLRVGALSGAVVLLDDCEGLLSDRDARLLATLESLDQNEALVILTTNHASTIDFAFSRRILYRLDFERPGPALRHHIWELHLPAEAPLHPNIDVAVLAAAYEFTGAQIRNTVLLALRCLTADGGTELTMARLREAADTQLSAGFGELAVKAGSHHTLERLVLPEREASQMREILSACRHREFILTQWGFAESLTTGRGLCVLFDGPPGTGKTFAAELLAAELKIPLYRVHIPNVVSKWVGETERNIAAIFERARAARAMLLFDEADSLFGRRTTNAQSSNDRYANMEVNLLLQEVERYDGVTILTTNLYGNLDPALQRRIQMRLTFPFPEAAERARIWEVLVPRRAPLADDVDFSALGARIELAGGHIKNALLRAAYRAREEGGPIRHAHLLDAAVAECRAQGKIVRQVPLGSKTKPSPEAQGEPG